MNVRTTVRDGLLLNWALAEEDLPKPPAPLRYHLQHLQGSEGPKVLACALLSFHDAVPLSALPLLRFSYPQFSLALAVVDHEGIPSFLFRRVLVPPWVLPAARLVARQPVVVARLAFDRPSESPDSREWRWRIEKEEAFEVSARLAAPQGGALTGSWQRDVDLFRQRHRGYYLDSRGDLKGVRTAIPEARFLPLAAEAHEQSLLDHCLPLQGEARWPALHSAVLFPELPFESELCLTPQVSLAGQMPQPAASRRTSLGAA
ncbi:MAG: DUF2071 domain-containing protein [Acidobacteria bacterium]|nr:DUF2071 domain-containing protein [Acidobacteriota bacterium]